VADGLRFHDLGPLEVERGGLPVPVGGARLAPRGPRRPALVRLTLAHTLASGGRADLAAPHRARATALLDGTAHALSPVIAEVHVLLTHSLLIAGDVEQAATSPARSRRPPMRPRTASCACWPTPA